MFLAPGVHERGVHVFGSDVHVFGTVTDWCGCSCVRGIGGPGMILESAPAKGISNEVMVDAP